MAPRSVKTTIDASLPAPAKAGSMDETSNCWAVHCGPTAGRNAAVGLGVGNGVGVANVDWTGNRDAALADACARVGLAASAQLVRTAIAAKQVSM